MNKHQSLQHSSSSVHPDQLDSISNLSSLDADSGLLNLGKSASTTSLTYNGLPTALDRLASPLELRTPLAAKVRACKISCYFTLLQILLAYLDQSEATKRNHEVSTLNNIYRVLNFLLSTIQLIVSYRYYNAKLQVLKIYRTVEPRCSIYQTKLLNPFIVELLVSCTFIPPMIDTVFYWDGYRYYLTDLVTALIYLKIYHIIRYHFEASHFASVRAQFVCGLMNFQPGLRFLLKKQVRTSSFMTSVYVISVMCFLTGLIVSMFERQHQKTFEYTENGIYLTFVTLITIGYGDLYPQTQLGRLFISVLAILSIILFAYVVYALDTAIIQTRAEKACLAEQNYILLKRPKLRLLSAIVIQRWIKLHLQRKRREASFNLLAMYMNGLNHFKNQKIQYNLKSSPDVEDGIQNLQGVNLSSAKVQQKHLPVVQRHSTKNLRKQNSVHQLVQQLERHAKISYNLGQEISKGCPSNYEDLSQVPVKTNLRVEITRRSISNVQKFKERIQSFKNVSERQLSLRVSNGSFGNSSADASRKNSFEFDQFVDEEAKERYQRRSREFTNQQFDSPELEHEKYLESRNKASKNPNDSNSSSDANSLSSENSIFDPNADDDEPMFIDVDRPQKIKSIDSGCIILDSEGSEDGAKVAQDPEKIMSGQHSLATRKSTKPTVSMDSDKSSKPLL